MWRPTLNAVSFWLTAAGAYVTSHWSSRVRPHGLASLPPLSESSPIRLESASTTTLALQISGSGNADGRHQHGHDHPQRCAHPGMNYMRMPHVSLDLSRLQSLIVAAFPFYVTLAMLLLDRYVGSTFFTNERRPTR